LLSEVTAMSVKLYCSPLFKPHCITVVPCTDKAVVTLPYERSIQFINITNNTKDNKIKIGEGCLSVTAVKDKIYIGGVHQVLNVIPFGRSTPSCLLNTISRNVPSGDNLCMASDTSPLMYTLPC
jgi:hypothetical protein